ncbi:MAG: 3-deoxy-manno-octulosonate cytidylyltransferase [Deferribacteres bacterium]|nr:3-deoxy-manno-octulosonate cytidylyltransferase [candidate division KSB1 bacterium]MCB9502678.1 3-deoxy-manno-octulosonate cytidylyltransferase [Deferribacteres bacterium]
MSSIGIIPARFASTRFPGKPLAMIGDKPMIQHVYERATEAKFLQKVVVATDDKRILNAVEAFGGNVVMTRTDHRTGSDRIAEVAQQNDFELIVNIQGDEPFVDPQALDKTIQLLIDSPEAVVSTLIAPIKTSEDLHNPSVVKVVIGKKQEALYFSRAIIPYIRDVAEIHKWLQYGQFYEHVGLYVYRRDILMQYVKWPQGTLEKLENLEQLRLLENGYKIVCAQIANAAICIDTPEDLKQAQQIWEERRRVH